MGEARLRRGTLVLLLLAGPAIALVVSDRAIVGWSAQWAWASRELSGGVLDPYRVEAVLRSTAPGPANVFVLGDSTARAGIDVDELTEAFAPRGLHFRNLGMGAAAASTWGMAADALVELEPTALILLVGSRNFRDDLGADRTRLYVIGAVPDMYTLADVLAAPRFHLDGAIGELHVLARHRRALQNAVLVHFGWRTWEEVRQDEIPAQEDLDRIVAEQMALVKAGRGYEALVRRPDHYPNPHTRGLERLARRASQHGVTLVVVETPQNPVAQAPTRARRQREAQTRAFLETASSQLGFVLVTSDGYPRLTGRDFRDGVHLNGRGRRRFTEYLAERLPLLL